MKHWIAMLMVLGAAYGRADAQDQTGELDSAFRSLEQCAALAAVAETDDASRKAAEESGRSTEALFSAAVTAEPGNAAAHYGLASTISQCRVPFAGITTVLTLLDRSTGAAKKALTIEPEHWGARFLLAMNYFHMPAMLGRTNDAIRELQRLIAQQRNATSPATFALTWIHLGDAYERTGRTADAHGTWSAGLVLFPENPELRRRLPTDHVPAAHAAGAPAAGAGIVALDALIVDAGGQQLDGARSGTALRRLDVYTMPGGTGEMMQALQSLPGVTRAGDGADMYVRGGDPAETPVFVDGGRLAFPGRWESLNGPAMGVLEASVLSKTYFSAGGFSARYGDALSGVVDVETRGRPETRSWRAGANMVQAGASIFEPIGERTGAWLTASATDTRLVTRMTGQSELYPSAPRSFQAIGGAAFAPARGVELRTMALAMRDMSTRTVTAGSYSGDFESDGTTLHAAASGRALRSDGRAGVEASVATSQRQTGFSLGVLERDRTDGNVHGRVDFEYGLDRTRLRTGTEIASLSASMHGRVPATPNLAPGSPSIALDGTAARTAHVGAYAEAEHQPLPGLALVAGIRADRLPGEHEITVDPRLAVGYTSGAWTLRAGGGVYHQGSWRRTYRLPEEGAPGGTPRRAQHFVAGAELNGEPSIRVEAWTKAYDSYVPAGDGPQITAGRANGVDMIVRWSQQSRLNGWVSWSLLDAHVDLAGGTRARAPYDVTHTVTAVGRLALTDDWELGTTARYGTGRPYTPVTGSMPGADGAPPTPIYGTVQSERMPDMQRLDARLTRYVRMDGMLGVLYVEMLNLLDRRNVMAWSYDTTWTQRSRVDALFAHRTFVLGAEVSH